jgi:hypothetical protein
MVISCNTFLGVHNDNIEIYITVTENGKLVVTDDKVTIFEASSLLDTDKVSELVKIITNFYSIEEFNTELYITTDLNNFKTDFTRFIQALIASHFLISNMNKFNKTHRTIDTYLYEIVKNYYLIHKSDGDCKSNFFVGITSDSDMNSKVSEISKKHPNMYGFTSYRVDLDKNFDEETAFDFLENLLNLVIKLAKEGFLIIENDYNKYLLSEISNYYSKLEFENYWNNLSPDTEPEDVLRKFVFDYKHISNPSIDYKPLKIYMFRRNSNIYKKVKTKTINKNDKNLVRWWKQLCSLFGKFF